MMIFNCTGFKGKWSKWSQWSQCSNYVQKRTRACHTQSCSGEKVEKKACNEKEKGKGNIDQDVVAAQDQEGIISSSGYLFNSYKIQPFDTLKPQAAYRFFWMSSFISHKLPKQKFKIFL